MIIFNNLFSKESPVSISNFVMCAYKFDKFKWSSIIELLTNNLVKFRLPMFSNKFVVSDIAHSVAYLFWEPRKYLMDEAEQ